MTEQLLKTAVKTGFSFAAALAVGAIYFGRLAWAGGVLAGACWMFLNVYFLCRLLAVGMRVEVQKDPNHLLVLSVLKFPVIYLTGYFILKARYFPVESILAGLTALVGGLVISWVLTQKRHPERSEGSLRPVASSISKDSSSASSVLRMTFLILLISGYCSPVFASEATHSEGHGSSSLHTTNIIGLIGHFLPEPAAKALEGYENLIFGVLVILILSSIFFAASRNMKLIPGRLQSACEAVVEGLNGFVCGIIGPEGKKYTPFLGTLFLYILTMNLLGLIPLMKSNTANSMTLSGPVALPVPTTTVALALIVFVTVQVIGIRKQGILGYLDHMAGSPRDVFGFVMAPLMFPIHLIGEFAKPFSLTFRLFCNTMGGHILVAVFIGMGVGAMFIPFQAPFLLFEIATSTIQAFVFTLLSTVYIAMMMPHGDHESHSHTAEVH